VGYVDDAAWKNCNQYLVFNNTVQTIDDIETKQGVMIKISGGMLMSFQGNTKNTGL